MAESQLSRPRSDSPKVELRGDVERDVVDVLDAVSAARRISRMELVSEILSVWADAKVHESMMVQRVTRREGCAAEGQGRG